MMSQVKNSKLQAKGLWLIVILFVALTGCEQGDPFVNQSEQPNPNWKLTVENDLMSSMTAIVKVSIASQPGILAAFIGDDCCGVTSSENYIDGRYNLFISPSAQGENVLLKFYSPDLKRVFVAKETFVYVNDGRLGSPSAPYTPTWTVAK